MKTPKLRFSAIGMNHGHIYGQTQILLDAGAELVSYYAEEPDLMKQYGDRFPWAKPARSKQEILEDETIQMVISAAIPCERADLGIEVMQHSKDYMSDKPGFTTLEQVAEARRVQKETGRIYSVCFSERLDNPVSVRTAELIRSGAIGRVVQTIGLGPHRANLPSRPDWFFQRQRYGGILIDIASHQFDQFLYYTGSTQAEIISAQVGNFKYPQYPELEDFGDVTLRSETAAGFIRVDWYTPDGLATWGDGRLFILGTEGYIENRKYIDIAGRPGGNHLFWVDHKGTHYEDCTPIEKPYGRQLIEDVFNRTETAMSQEHAFYASELAIRAENQAVRLGYLQKG